jgi:hypothetical protein
MMFEAPTSFSNTFMFLYLQVAIVGSSTAAMSWIFGKSSTNDP